MLAFIRGAPCLFQGRGSAYAMSGATEQKPGIYPLSPFQVKDLHLTGKLKLSPGNIETMLNFFKRKKSTPVVETKKPALIVVTLNARLQPVHRHEIEDAFVDIMAKYHNQDVEIVGGGTALSTDGEVECSDIEIELGELNEQLVSTVIEVFTAMLAPKGSFMTIEDRKISFGEQEGLALYLNGTELPSEVYEQNDSHAVYDECERLLNGVGGIHSHWNGPKDTAFYMYGDSFTEMELRLAPLIASHPLCQKCRIEKIA